MKRNFIILISVLSLYLLVHGYLVYGCTSEQESRIDVETVYDLLSERTSIMNRGLYSDEDINNIFEDLREIERGNLLQEDIDCLRDARSNPTDYPLVTGIRMLKMDLLVLKDNIYRLRALIQWEVLEVKEETENIEYFIEIHKQDKKLSLISLDPVE